MVGIILEILISFFAICFLLVKCHGKKADASSCKPKVAGGVGVGGGGGGGVAATKGAAGGGNGSPASPGAPGAAPIPSTSSSVTSVSSHKKDGKDDAKKKKEDVEDEDDGEPLIINVKKKKSPGIEFDDVEVNPLTKLETKPVPEKKPVVVEKKVVPPTATAPVNTVAPTPIKPKKTSSIPVQEREKTMFLPNEKRINASCYLSVADKSKMVVETSAQPPTDKGKSNKKVVPGKTPTNRANLIPKKLLRSLTPKSKMAKLEATQPDVSRAEISLSGGSKKSMKTEPTSNK